MAQRYNCLVVWCKYLLLKNVKFYGPFTLNTIYKLYNLSFVYLCGMDRNNISKIIRAARLQAGLSQSALASKCGVSQQAIQKLESGNNRVGFNALQRIIDALNIEVNIVMKPAPMQGK